MNPARAVLVWMCCVGVVLCPLAHAEDDPGTVVIPRKTAETEMPPSIFPHWVHRIRYRCYACHPEPFQMNAGGTTITMDLMAEGKLCGMCHNGTYAWPINFETCNRCHQGAKTP